MPSSESASLWFLLLLPSLINGVASPGTMRLELVHRLDPRAAADGGGGETPQQDLRDRVEDMLRNDRMRERLRKERTGRGGVRPDISGDMPMRSAADYGTGQYLVTLGVGSPAQSMTLIVDTGSDLTWVKCESIRCRGLCGGGPRPTPPGQPRPNVFRADKSWSFRTVACSSELCRVKLADMFSLKRCPTPWTPCAFDYQYLEGSAVLGIFASETLTLSPTKLSSKRVHSALVGCAGPGHGRQSSFGAADGVLGMGFSELSFAREAARRFAGKFSYCLVDHLSPRNVSSYLTFGGGDDAAAPRHGMHFTNLLLGVISPSYAVDVLGISLDGVMLNIPTHVWDSNRNGGTILDSGTSLTFLTQPAYQPLMAALQQSLLKFRRVDPGIELLEHCFDSAGFDESLVPKLSIHFAGGARLEPAAGSYVIEAAEGVRCLGFVSAAWPGISTIGNILQQRHLWEFDLMRNRVGFAPSQCT